MKRKNSTHFEIFIRRNATQTAKGISNVYGPNAVSVRVAQNWFKRFQSGNLDFKVESSSGRSGLPVTDKVDTILGKVEQDRHISSYDIAKELGIDHKTVLTHSKKSEYTKKLDTRVPHELIEGIKEWCIHLRFSIETGIEIENNIGVKIEFGIGVGIESLIGIEIPHTRELFALGYVRIRTVIGSGIRIESGTGDRIAKGKRITIESGTKIENGTGVENEHGFGIRTKITDFAFDITRLFVSGQQAQVAPEYGHFSSASYSISLYTGTTEQHVGVSVNEYCYQTGPDYLNDMKRPDAIYLLFVSPSWGGACSRESLVCYSSGRSLNARGSAFE
ncbi:Histone-lysine N-methyltransferase SETMAR [Eumeta japonica]|uniref:Histone-lysine N-methyltransferase SETMAR n=1 Tax=Eumeta variegata TaxID=151549 RepID=A0A4C1WYT5_EUMVA|nr:Histone-lysine N-methyltransferase SETMAR [Eumeta japonica]